MSTSDITEITTAGVPSVITAFGILDAIADSDVPPTMIELARQLDVPKSSASRILRTLETIGAIHRDESDRTYRLGERLRQYARSSSTPAVLQRFERLGAAIARSVNETTQFGMLSGTDVVFAACIESTRPVRLVSFVGRTLPAHASATGKAILAFSSEEEVARVIAAGLPGLTGNTITDAGELRRELAEIRVRGYATETEESTDNLSCIAAPVFDSSDTVIGAVTICIPRNEIPASRFATLRDAVLELSAQLSTPSIDALPGA